MTVTRGSQSASQETEPLSSLFSLLISLTILSHFSSFQQVLRPFTFFMPLVFDNDFTPDFFINHPFILFLFSFSPWLLSRIPLRHQFLNALGSFHPSPIVLGPYFVPLPMGPMTIVIPLIHLRRQQFFNLRTTSSKLFFTIDPLHPLLTHRL